MTENNKNGVDLSKDIKVNFIVKRFNFKGIVYNADELEASAKQGDADAMKVIADLVEIESGVIETVNA